MLPRIRILAGAIGAHVSWSGLTPDFVPKARQLEMQAVTVSIDAAVSNTVTMGVQSRWPTAATAPATCRCAVQTHTMILGGISAALRGTVPDRAILFLFSVVVEIASLAAAGWLLATGQAASVDGLFLLLTCLLVALAFGLFIAFMIRRAMEPAPAPAAQPAKANAAPAQSKPAPAPAAQV